MQKAVLAVALGAGLSIAYLDTRPHWDDAGITALAIFASCFLCGVVAPSRPWLLALAIGSWIPLYGIAASRNYASLLALFVAFAGAYAAKGFRLLSGPRPVESADLIA